MLVSGAAEIITSLATGIGQGIACTMPESNCMPASMIFGTFCTSIFTISTTTFTMVGSNVGSGRPGGRYTETVYSCQRFTMADHRGSTGNCGRPLRLQCPLPCCSLPRGLYSAYLRPIPPPSLRLSVAFPPSSAAFHLYSMVTGIVNIVTEVPQKIWNCIIGAVTKVATWGANMISKAKEVMNNMVAGIVAIVSCLPGC